MIECVIHWKCNNRTPTQTQAHSYKPIFEQVDAKILNAFNLLWFLPLLYKDFILSVREIFLPFYF